MYNNGVARGAVGRSITISMEVSTMRSKKILLGILFGILALVLAACGGEAAVGETADGGSGGSGPLGAAAGTQAETDYAGYQFAGRDPWDGTLTLTVLRVEGDDMDWSFTDSYEGHTLYQVQKGTVLQDGVGTFALEGKDVEQEGITFAYQGTLELRDGNLTVTFQSGSVAGEPVSRTVESLSDEARTVVLDRTDEGPYTIYTVQSGDSVHSIAQAHGISTKDLCILNQIVIMETAKAHGYTFDDVTEYAKYLFPGEELLVPLQ